MKRSVKLFVLLSIVACLSFGLAPSARADEYYTISSYDYKATVLPGNVCEVTETIDVAFSEPQHGIYRSIPYIVTTYRQSTGKPVRRKYELAVRDIQVDGWPYAVDRSGGWVNITVGDKDKLVEGEQRYTLRYTLEVGNDFIDDFDEVYLNVIGLGWNAVIESASFTVELPKPFDASRVEAVSGGAGYENPGQVEWEASGSAVSGTITSPLQPYEGVTLRVELPQGYFTELPDPYAPDKAALAAVLLLGAAGAVLFLLFGRDIKPVRPVEVAPPDGMDPAELGYVYDGRVSPRDVLSLLPYWADKGYLAIERNKKAFRLHKLKDLPENAKGHEKYFFGELFRQGDTVSSDNLPDSTAGAVYAAAAMVENEFYYSGRSVITWRSRKLQPWLAAAAVLPVMAALALAFYRNMFNWPLTVFAAVVMGLLGFFPAFALIRVLSRWHTYRRSAAVLRLSLLLLLYAGSMAAFLAYAASAPILPLLPAASALISAALGVFAVFFRRRTPQGREWLGRALGFRGFISSVEKDRLRALLEQDPGMFYAVLPYACVLGVTDKWARNFDKLSVRPPEWYSGYDRQFSPDVIARCVSDAMAEFQSHAYAVSTAQSGGGSYASSGGAVTGGGVGGGGGGTW